MSNAKMAPAPMLPADKSAAPEMTDENSILVFAIEHDDGSVFEKRILNAARPNLSYGYMRRIRKVGQMEADAWMLEQVIGDDGMEALEEYEGLDEDMDNAIKARVRDITSGGTQNPKG